MVATDEDVACFQCAHTNDHRGCRSAALLNLGFDDCAAGVERRAGFEFEHFGLEKHGVEKVAYAGAFRSAYWNTDRFTAPIFGSEAFFLQLGADTVRIGRRHVDFVDGHHDFYLGGFGVGDRFERLRHEAVICCNNNDYDVRDICSPGAHGGEGGVSGRVEKGNFLAISLDAVGADMLRDAAGFTSCNAGLANGIEKRGFSVVYMTHESDNRGAKLKFVDLGWLGGFGNFHLGLDLVMSFGGVLALTLECKSMHITDFSHNICFNRLVQICKNLERHQVLDELEGLETEFLR